MAGGERAFGLRAAEPCENDDFTEVDEGETRRTRDYVLHQKRNALCVIDHADIRRRADTRGLTTASLSLQLGS